MAITFKGGSGDLAPAYNPMWFYVDSTNKGKTGFRYIFDVYDAGTSNSVRHDPPPRPGDGWGQFDLSTMAQCRLSYDANPGLTTAFSALDSFWSYDLKIGESYVAEYTYTGYGQLTGSGTPYDGNVKLTGLTSHPFAVGSMIEINQTDGGVAVPLLQGAFNVVNVPNSSTVVINLPYYLVDGLAAMGGFVVYSDHRPTVFPNLHTISDYTAYNAALDVDQFNGYDFDGLKMTTDTGAQRFITSMPNNFKIDPQADLFFNVANMNTTNPFYLRIVNSNGDVFRKTLSPSTGTKIMQVPVGCGNLGVVTVISGTPPIIKDDTTQYDVRITDSSGNQVSELRTFVLDRRCNAKDIHLSFVDRQGAIGQFAFPLQAMFDNEFEKEVTETDNGGFDVGAGMFQYDQLKGGKKTIYSERVAGVTLTTNWMDSQEQQYFNELLSSVAVFIYLDGVYKLVDVVTASQPTPHPLKKKLVNRVVQVKWSNLNPINA